VKKTSERKLTYSQYPTWLVEFIAFGTKNAISCGFPVFVMAMLGLSNIVSLGNLARYDFLLIVCILAQALMYFLKLESKREVLVVFGFHAIGLALELHKVNVGSWSYPEDAWSKIGGVPLYSGFMYASVASYICRAWHLFDLKITHWPKNTLALIMGGLIYLNFFTNAYVQDIRWFLFPLLIVVFRKTKVLYTPFRKQLSMPLLVSFCLIGFFIWLAENIATLFNAWKYSYQHNGWEMVAWGKLSSWALLIIVSIIMVAQLKLWVEPKKRINT
jgi:uncharacterized membrane protein YoaT (DUF817 family)